MGFATEVRSQSPMDRTPPSIGQPRPARGANAARSQLGTRWANWLGPSAVAGLLINMVACSTADPGPPPVPPPVPTTTVFAVVRGSVVSGGKPVALAELKIWGYKDVCRSPTTDSPLVVADAQGAYERVVEYLGSPGRACVVVRFYRTTAAGRDSVDVGDNFVAVKANRNGAVPDTLIVNGNLP